ncbi:MAG: transcriptional regulator, MarR family, partial [Chloroflexi bacterium]|nr:transcriptional regulator, MarR family [Chloroflexota bacterium]
MADKQLDRAELMDALSIAGRKISTYTVLFSQAAADRMGMNATDMECGDILSWTGPITAGRLAELSGLTTGAITGVIDRLERAGFVRREKDPTDRRRVIVMPLQERYDEVMPLYQGMIHSMNEFTDRYTEQELAVLLDFTTKMGNVLFDEAVKL